MKLQEATSAVIGKKCSFIFTGLKSTGVITGVSDNEHAVHIEVKFDRPINWGGEYYENSQFFIRKCDGWGSGQNIEILN